METVEQMFMCGHFDEVDLTAWEKRAADQKTLTDANTYLLKKYK